MVGSRVAAGAREARLAGVGRRGGRGFPGGREAEPSILRARREIGWPGWPGRASPGAPGGLENVNQLQIRQAEPRLARVAMT